MKFGVKQPQSSGRNVLWKKVLLQNIYFFLTATKVQLLSENRLWIHLALGPVTSLVKVGGWLGSAKVELIQAGMPESVPFFGIGHSVGGEVRRRDPNTT